MKMTTKKSTIKEERSQKEKVTAITDIDKKQNKIREEQEEMAANLTAAANTIYKQVTLP